MSSERPYNRFLGRLRLLFTLVAVVALIVLARPTGASVGIGAVLVALGEAIRFWSAGHLFKTQELVTSGPYRYTRNPLYLGRLFIFSGLCIMVWLPYGGSLVALAIGWTVFFGYYMPRKERVEPARLLEVHGEPYARYRDAVPGLFPRLTPWQEATVAGWSWQRMVRNREYLMVFGLTLVTAYLAWRATTPDAWSPWT